MWASRDKSKKVVHLNTLTKYTGEEYNANAIWRNFGMCFQHLEGPVTEGSSQSRDSFKEVSPVLSLLRPWHSLSSRKGMEDEAGRRSGTQELKDFSFTRDLGKYQNPCNAVLFFLSELSFKEFNLIKWNKIPDLVGLISGRRITRNVGAA